MLRSIQIKNFKAIADSGRIQLTPLTVFVGHNGTGKSSVLESLEFFQRYVQLGVDEAIAPWYDIDHILWQGHDREKDEEETFFPHPLEISLTGKEDRNWRSDLRIGKLAEDANGYKAKMIATKFEAFEMDLTGLWKRKFGEPATRSLSGAKKPEELHLVAGQSVLADAPLGSDRWMFLNLDPFAIGQPRARRGTGFETTLNRSGSNLSAFLLSFLDLDPDGFDAMIDSLRYVLPYVADLRAEVVRDMVESRSLLRLTEGFANRHAHLPGWVLSGGTLRLLAILAALRHPKAPEVLCIEELENGLDPRAIGFLVEEIRNVIENEGRQVITTTHSPYLLDKLLLSHIVTVDRLPGGPPVFSKPADSENLKAWSEKFAPGSLYTMGMFRRNGRQE